MLDVDQCKKPISVDTRIIERLRMEQNEIETSLQGVNGRSSRSQVMGLIEKSVRKSRRGKFFFR